MRLLNTSTYTLTEFQGKIPPYAILSHVWQREEVTFRDIVDDQRKAKNMQGFAKIRGACDTAKRDGFEYIWIDTCCINKESSTELSEAINSMYAWYKNAHICYAYLWDVPSKGNHNNARSLFAMSMWFTRGWTLQELIAPRNVVFYGADWVDIGTKASLHKVISAVTGIGMEVIAGKIVLDDVPVAVRMSWAAHRNTTREEDTAYSLMGVFDVNMPLLYGEGKKAFIRLQHEIIKKSDDHSIFAWALYRPENTPQLASSTYRGMLARSPTEFRHSGEVERIPQVDLGLTQPNERATNSPTPYSITNRGVHIELPIEVVEDKTLAFLNCRLLGNSDPLTITLVSPHDLHQYVRLGTERLETNSKGSTVPLSSLYIPDDYQKGSLRSLPPSLELEIKVPPNYQVPRIRSYGFNGRRESQRVIFYDHGLDMSILVFEESHEFEPFAIVVGHQRTLGGTWCEIITDIKLQVESMRQFGERIISEIVAARNHYWNVKKLFLDRTSVRLTNGWSVTVSLAPTSSPEPALRGEVDITKSLELPHPALPPVLPISGQKAYLFILPAPQHGFAVDIDNLQQASPINWVQDPHSFSLSISDYAAVELPFKSTTTKEKFYLVLYGVLGYSNIEKESHDRNFYDHQYWSRHKDESYRAIVGKGKLVFVSRRRCKDESVADFIITLSM